MFHILQGYSFCLVGAVLVYEIYVARLIAEHICLK